ncbi:MAG: tetratricopeptide repeat protein [Acidobacteria bacterium]|nr:tetratricopeptide repeat protein [Acidobacteriota bacterium]
MIIEALPILVRRLAAICFCCFLLAGCKVANSRALKPIPEPDFGSLESAIVDQLRQQQAVLASAINKANISDKELSETFGATGKFYHSYNLAEPAIACYENAKQLGPGDYRWQHYLARLYKDKNDLKQAALNFGSVIALKPDYVPAIIGMAEINQAQNFDELAEPLFQEALTKDRSNAVAIAGLGKIALAKRDYPSAIRQLENALKLAPAATELYYPLAQAYRGYGNLAKAEESLSKRGSGTVSMNDPLMAELRGLTTGARNHLLRGSQLIQAQRYKEAIEEFRLAAAADPNDATIRLNLGSTFAQLGQRQEARDELAEAIRIDPSNAKANYNLAVVLAQLRDDLKAINHFRIAAVNDNRNASAHFFLADSLMRTGQYLEAANAYSQAIAVDPRHGMAHFRLALAQIKLGRLAEARAKLEEELKALQGNKEIAQVLVRLLAASPDQKIRDGKRAVGIVQSVFSDQRNPNFAQSVAMAFAEVGQFDQAIELQQLAIDAARDSNHSTLQKMLAEDLARYRRKLPCRRPWLENDSIFSPAPPF